MIEISIGYEHKNLLEQAKALAFELDLPVDNDALNQLLVTTDKLMLKIHPFSPLCADFSYDYWQKRHDEGKKQGLVRACKPKPGMKILDLTAGWGRDAAVLASFGAQVTMLERNPVLAALLRDALQRAPLSSKKTLPLELIHGDAMVYLNTLKEDAYPDIAYIDPMHPERKKTALVKKDLQMLQQLLGPDEDPVSLIQLARQRVKICVVVKWPQNLPPLLKATGSVEGKTVRFDIYRGSRSS